MNGLSIRMRDFAKSLKNIDIALIFAANQIEALDRENDRLRSVVRFYADEQNWEQWIKTRTNGGKLAKDTLESK